MSAEDEGIFPILDRDTPIIDRLKERREQMRSNGDVRSLGHRIARAALTGEEVDENFLNSLRADIAQELDIPEDQISGMYLSELRSALSPSINALVNQPSLEQENTDSNDESSDENQSTTESENGDDEEGNESSSTPVLPSETSTDDTGSEGDEADQVF